MSYRHKHDPFGLHPSLEHARKERHPLWRLGAQLADGGITLLAALPLLFLLAMMVLLLLTPGQPVRWALGLLAAAWVGGFALDTLRLRQPRPKPEAAPKASMGRVAVIGAGPVGLAVVKECRAAGLEVACFDRQEKVGGVYFCNDTFPGGVWDSVRLTTSPWITAFADFPPSNDSSRQLHHSAYRDYLEAYARAFNLFPAIHLQHDVVTAQHLPEGGWRVTVRDLSDPSAKDAERTEHFDHVVVSSGLNLQPKGIDIPGMDTFTGTIEHVAHYRDPKRFAGKTVVVVGIGESGADIAAELAEHATARLSMGRGKFIIPRMNPLNGVANDYDTNRARYAAPVVVRDAFMTLKRRLCVHLGLLDREAALRARLLEVSGVGPMSQTVTKNDAIIPKLLDSSLELRRSIVRFDGDKVVYDDGFEEQVDAVLFAHGYQPSFPFLDLGEGAQLRHPGLLYLNMVHPSLGDTLFFCGFARPAIGSIPPTGELQARYVAQLLSGRRVLPTSAEMEQAVVAQYRRIGALYPTQKQPHVVISWIDYMDTIAEKIGCRPDPLHLLTRPRLAWKVATGPMTGAVYRLHGPGASHVAEETVLKLPRMHQLRELLTHVGLHMSLWPFARLSSHPRWRSASSTW